MQLFEKKIVDIVHQLFMEYVHEGDIVIDATAGGGQDTLKLCECVGSTGKVYAFDIQQEALTSAARLLDQNGMGDRFRYRCCLLRTRRRSGRKELCR